MRCLWRATALRRCRSSKRAARAKPGYQLRLTIRRTGPARTGRRPTWSRRRAWRRSAPCLDRINEPLLAQGRDGAPGRRPRDLVRLNKLTLGRDAGVRRVLPGQDPALDDRRYLQVGRYGSERVDPLIRAHHPRRHRPRRLPARTGDAVVEPPGRRTSRTHRPPTHLGGAHLPARLRASGRHARPLTVSEPLVSSSDMERATGIEPA